MVNAACIQTFETVQGVKQEHSKEDLRIRNMRSLIFLPLSVSFVAGSFRSMQNCETQQRQIMERDLICDMPQGGELHL